MGTQFNLSKMNLSILVTTAFVAAAGDNCGTKTIACQTNADCSGVDLTVWADGCNAQILADVNNVCVGTTATESKGTCAEVALKDVRTATNCSELTAALMFEETILDSGYPLDQEVVNHLCAAFTNKDGPQDSCKAIESVVSQMYTKDTDIELCVVDESSTTSTTT